MRMLSGRPVQPERTDHVHPLGKSPTALVTVRDAFQNTPDLQYPSGFF